MQRMTRSRVASELISNFSKEESAYFFLTFTTLGNDKEPLHFGYTAVPNFARPTSAVQRLRQRREAKARKS